MLRKGGVTLLSRALQQSAGLVQQPQNSVQQPCVQLLQVLNLQAVRFRSKQSSPKYRDSLTRADKAAIARAKALDRAMAAAQAAGLLPATASPAAASSDAPASQESSSSGATTPAASEGQAGASAASTSSTSTSSSSSSSSSWTPQWLRDIVGDTRRRRSRAPPPVQASPLTPAAATRDSAAKQRADEKQQAVAKSQGITVDGKEEADTDPYAADGWGTHLAQFADYSLDEFAEQIKNDPKSDSFEAPPRPMTPLRGPFARYGNVFDYKRVTYWRFETLYSVMRAMSPEDKLAVKLNPHFAKDQKAMQELADRVGTETDVLRDVFHLFNKQKRQFTLLSAHRNKGGTMPPINDQKAIRIVSERLVKQDEQDKYKALLKLRDPHKCQLRLAAAFATKADMRRICPQTQLHYSECCGRKNKLNAKGLLKAKRKLLSAA